MILYHTTTAPAARSILAEGLRLNKEGWSYLAPKPDQWTNMGDVVLVVETADAKLTAFENAEKHEVLCWAHIPAERIKVHALNIQVAQMLLGGPYVPMLMLCRGESGSRI